MVMVLWLYKEEIHHSASRGMGVSTTDSGIANSAVDRGLFPPPGGKANKISQISEFCASVRLPSVSLVRPRRGEEGSMRDGMELKADTSLGGLQDNGDHIGDYSQ